MTFEQYKGRKRRRVISVARNISIGVLTIGLMLFAFTAAVASKQDNASAGSALPGMQDQMQTSMQDMMVMMQNTAAWTPQGLVVLQGNRLLHYTPDLQLRQTITLPVPDTSDVATLVAPDAGAMQSEMPPAAVRSSVSARILATDDGLVVVRGKQAIELDGELHIVGQATLPDLPPLSTAEISAICPMSEQMMTMMGQGLPLGGADLVGMAKNNETVAAPAGAADLPQFIVPGSLGRATRF